MPKQELVLLNNVTVSAGARQHWQSNTLLMLACTGINRITVKSKGYIYPKIWVVLPVIQMTQSFGYNTS